MVAGLEDVAVSVGELSGFLAQWIPGLVLAFNTPRFLDHCLDPWKSWGPMLCESYRRMCGVMSSLY